MSEKPKLRKIHYNKPQLRSMMVSAHEEYAIWGRGTGKSEGLIAPRALQNMQAMPRSRGVFVGSTYLQLLERTLPPVIKGWQEQGYKEGEDFWIRKKPPKSENIPTPHVGPLTPEHSIYWRNGSVASLVSQDRPGTSNGMSVDWIIGDEAKLLRKDRLEEELILANRGNERYFRGIPEHHSLLFATDMPTSARARWILEKKDLMDPERIRLILSLQAEIYKCQKDGRDTSRYVKYWNELRSEALYFSEASTLDNIEVLGTKYIAQLRRHLPDIIYQTAVLNKRIVQVVNGFYPYLDEERHCYDAYDYTFIDSEIPGVGAGTISDCRKDNDLDRTERLSIALDYGGTINTLVVGQRKGNILRYVNALYEKNPRILDDLVNQFCDYYQQYPTRDVKYSYDHTALGTRGDSTESFADKVQRILRERGWSVEPKYLGKTTSHHARHLLWGDALKGHRTDIVQPLFNRSNCTYLIISMQQAGIKTGRTGFEKDKTAERKDVDQRETTHFSDAADTLLVAEQEAFAASEVTFIDNIYF